MSTYFVSFRIAERTTTSGTAGERRQSLVDLAYEASDGFWAETTAFIILGSSLPTGTMCRDICAGLDPEWDLAIVFDPDDMSLAYFGPVDRADILTSFFNVSEQIA